MSNMPYEIFCPILDYKIHEINIPFEFDVDIKITSAPEWYLQFANEKQNIWHKDRATPIGVNIKFENISSDDPYKNIKAFESSNDRVILVFFALWCQEPSGLVGGHIVKHVEEPNCHHNTMTIGRTFVPTMDQQEKTLNIDDWNQASEIFRYLITLKEDSPIRIAIHIWIKALTEQMAEVRYLLYWVGLETIYTMGRNEQRFRLSTFISLFIEDNSATRINRSKRIKELYDQRSSIAHEGKPGSKDEEKRMATINDTELIIRQTLKKIIKSNLADVFSKPETKCQFFENLIFGLQ